VGGEFYAGTETDRRSDGQTDKQTDVMKLMVAFQNFANRPKKRKKNICSFVYGMVHEILLSRAC